MSSPHETARFAPAGASAGVQTPDLHDVAGYAAAVRRALVGLGPEQVEDLTDGLEADLAEALADEDHARHGGDLVTLFGTPEEYAAELGAAAGLAPAVPTPPAGGLPPWLRHPLRALARLGGRWLAQLRREAWWPPFERFVVALRPAWWVLRGWVVYQLGLQFVGVYRQEMLPSSVIRFVWLVALVVASVQWGRGSWRPRRLWGAIPMVVSTVAAFAAIPVLATVSAGSTQYVYADEPPAVYEQVPMDGVVVDGMQVSNLFVYDAEGNPLDNVQIYDDRGRPVRTTYDEGQGQWYMPGDDMPWQFVGVRDEDGRVRWNVYPLHGAHADAYVYDEVTGQMVLADGTQPQLPPRPFAKAPAIVVPGQPSGSEASDEAVPSPTPPPSPEAVTSPSAPEPTSPAPAPTP